MTSEEIALGILERERRDGWIDGVADPAIFASMGGPSIAEQMGTYGVHWRPADNKRTATAGAIGGWDQLRLRLKGDGDGRPMIFFFSTCKDATARCRSCSTIGIGQKTSRQRAKITLAMKYGMYVCHRPSSAMPRMPRVQRSTGLGGMSSVQTKRRLG